MTFERFDVVVVPFPFTDGPELKRRPAVVLSDSRSFNSAAGHCVLAMITSARHSRWPLDVPLRDSGAAGLSRACIVRMKLFTLAEPLILGRSGSLSSHDAHAVDVALRKLWGAPYQPSSPAADAAGGARVGRKKRASIPDR